MTDKKQKAEPIDLDPEKVQQGQHTLVNTAIGIALDMAYADANKQGKPIKNHHGQNKKETFEALKKIPDDRDRVRAFNQLVKRNGENTATFDLSLKSSGAKSEERTQTKAEVLNQKPAEISDIVRMTAVSGNVAILDEFAKKMENSLKKQQHKMKPFSNMEEWSLRPKLLLNKVLKSKVDGLGAEVQFLCRQQAHIATRITHKYYGAYRLLDAPQPTSKDKEKFIAQYNEIAGWVNELVSHEKHTEEDVLAANKLLLTEEMSTVTFDDVSEGGSKVASEGEAASNGKHMSYAWIFKNPQQLDEYAGFVQQLAAKGDVKLTLPMPLLDPALAHKEGRKELDTARDRLFRLTQVTHGCYMAEAPETMRNLFVDKARGLNRLDRSNGNPPSIPTSILEMIPHTLGPDKTGGRHGR